MFQPLFVNWLPPNWMQPQLFEADTREKAVIDDPFIGSQVVYVNGRRPQNVPSLR